jgi:hypothetical protein
MWDLLDSYLKVEIISCLRLDYKTLSNLSMTNRENYAICHSIMDTLYPIEAKMVEDICNEILDIYGDQYYRPFRYLNTQSYNDLQQKARLYTRDTFNLYICDVSALTVYKAIPSRETLNLKNKEIIFHTVKIYGLPNIHEIIGQCLYYKNIKLQKESCPLTIQNILASIKKLTKYTKCKINTKVGKKGYLIIHLEARSQ